MNGPRAWLDKSERFEEVTIRDISRWGTRFDFKICIKDPETGHVNDPHAHLMNPKIKGDKADLMERLKLSDKIPRSLADIQDAFPDEKKYKPIPDDRKLIIFDWAKKPNKKMPKFTNWEMLWAQWLYSVND